MPQLCQGSHRPWQQCLAPAGLARPLPVWWVQGCQRRRPEFHPPLTLGTGPTDLDAVEKTSVACRRYGTREAVEMFVLRESLAPTGPDAAEETSGARTHSPRRAVTERSRPSVTGNPKRSRNTAPPPPPLNRAALRPGRPGREARSTQGFKRRRGARMPAETPATRCPASSESRPSTVREHYPRSWSRRSAARVPHEIR